MPSLLQRSVHVGVGFALIFLIFPASKKSSRKQVAWYDWIWFIFSLSGMAYLIYEYQDIVTSRGGMCSDGPCDHKRYSLYEDGRFEDHENLTKTEVTRIKNIVSKSSFSTMSAPEDERQCDSYVDGEDVVLIFPTIYGDRQFVPCEMLSDKEYGSLVYADITYVLSLIVRNDSHYYDFHNSRLNYGPSIVY